MSLSRRARGTRGGHPNALAQYAPGKQLSREPGKGSSTRHSVLSSRVGCGVRPPRDLISDDLLDDPTFSEDSPYWDRLLDNEGSTCAATADNEKK